MKRALRTAGAFGIIVLLVSMVKWDYIIYFMKISLQAAEQVVTGEGEPEEFKSAIENLSVGQFVNIPFFDEYMEENGITDENGEYVTMDEAVMSIIGEE